MKIIKVMAVISGLTLFGMLVIVPMVSAQSAGSDRQVKEIHYPARFERLGIISMIDREGVIIGDKYVSFASSVRFMTPYNKTSTLDSFLPGQSVGYVINKRGEITILCLILESNEGT